MCYTFETINKRVESIWSETMGVDRFPYWEKPWSYTGGVFMREGMVERASAPLKLKKNVLSRVQTWNS